MSRPDGRCLRLLLALLALAAGCRRTAPAGGPLRLGYFPNLTHAQALVGDADGTFRRAVPRLQVQQFNAGPAAMEALLAGAVDITYVGSGPAVIAFVRSERSLRVIAGASSGGAALVVRSARSAAELAGKKVAVPQLGNSQDIALRRWLRHQGLNSSDRGGTVEVLPQPNPEIVSLFRRGELEAAWVPEPWAARLVEAGGHVLVDERDLWEERRFPAAVIVATVQALEHRRDEVKAILRAHLELTARARASPAAFARQANEAYAALVGKPLPSAVLEDATSRLEFLSDPLAPQLEEIARAAVALGYLPPASMSGLVDDSLLRELAATGTAR